MLRLAEHRQQGMRQRSLQTFAITSRSRSYGVDSCLPFNHALHCLLAGVVQLLERPMRTLILIALALLSGCAGHNYSGALLLGIFLPDPNELTAEDREIMEREQAEADAAERREVGR